MTNAETISKLNNALSTLIKAYEELQEYNNDLKNRINELEDEVLELEGEKEDLEKNVDEFKNHTQEDKSNISSMLGKIEGILNRKFSDQNIASIPASPEKVEEKKEEIAPRQESPATNVNSGNHSDERAVKKEEVKEEVSSSSNKIDLNRMASLLNGFNH